MDKKKRQAIEKGKKEVKTGKPKSEPKAETNAASTAAKPIAGAVMPPLPPMPRESRSRKPKPTKPCACGCPTLTTGKWAPGHDARAKGWAIRVSRGLIKMNDVPENERPGAKLMLKAIADGGEQVKGKGIKLVRKPKAEQEATPESAPEGESAIPTESDVDSAVNQ